MLRYDVQVCIDGKWQWAAVAPKPMTRARAMMLMRREQTNPYWERNGITRFRVATVPRDRQASAPLSYHANGGKPV